LIAAGTACGVGSTEHSNVWGFDGDSDFAGLDSGLDAPSNDTTISDTVPDAVRGPFPFLQTEGASYLLERPDAVGYRSRELEYPDPDEMDRLRGIPSGAGRIPAFVSSAVVDTVGSAREKFRSPPAVRIGLVDGALNESTGRLQLARELPCEAIERLGGDVVPKETDECVLVDGRPVDEATIRRIVLSDDTTGVEVRVPSGEQLSEGLQCTVRVPDDYLGRYRSSIITRFRVPVSGTEADRDDGLKNLECGTPDSKNDMVSIPRSEVSGWFSGARGQQPLVIAAVHLEFRHQGREMVIWGHTSQEVVFDFYDSE